MVTGGGEAVDVEMNEMDNQIIRICSRENMDGTEDNDDYSGLVPPVRRPSSVLPSTSGTPVGTPVLTLSPSPEPNNAVSSPAPVRRLITLSREQLANAIPTHAPVAQYPAAVVSAVLPPAPVDGAVQSPAPVDGAVQSPAIVVSAPVATPSPSIRRRPVANRLSSLPNYAQQSVENDRQIIRLLANQEANQLKIINLLESINNKLNN